MQKADVITKMPKNALTRMAQNPAVHMIRTQRKIQKHLKRNNLFLVKHAFCMKGSGNRSFFYGFEGILKTIGILTITRTGRPLRFPGSQGGMLFDHPDGFIIAVFVQSLNDLDIGD